MKRKRLFGWLDRRAGKLNRAELGRGRLIIAQSDRDHDDTLTKEEYLALVEREFRAADPDRDSIVSRAEFKSRLGRVAHSAPHNCLPASPRRNVSENRTTKVDAHP